MSHNGFFKVDDVRSADKLPADWWSRPYEYGWAIQFAKGNVADMGCGSPYRPFRDYLAKICDHVYAVDASDRLLEQEFPENVTPVVADFTRIIGEIPAGSLDRVFCISVLEDLGEKIPAALREFKRVLKDDGLIVLTMDAQYDFKKPLGKYPGVKLGIFHRYVRETGLRFVGDFDNDKTDAVYREDFNLCCFHCILEKY